MYNTHPHHSATVSHLFTCTPVRTLLCIRYTYTIYTIRVVSGRCKLVDLQNVRPSTFSPSRHHATKKTPPRMWPTTHLHTIAKRCNDIESTSKLIFNNNKKHIEMKPKQFKFATSCLQSQYKKHTTSINPILSSTPQLRTNKRKHIHPVNRQHLKWHQHYK